jgi:hypothetical protein
MPTEQLINKFEQDGRAWQILNVDDQYVLRETLENDEVEDRGPFATMQEALDELEKEKEKTEKVDKKDKKDEETKKDETSE